MARTSLDSLKVKDETSKIKVEMSRMINKVEKSHVAYNNVFIE